MALSLETLFSKVPSVYAVHKFFAGEKRLQKLQRTEVPFLFLSQGLLDCFYFRGRHTRTNQFLADFLCRSYHCGRLHNLTDLGWLDFLTNSVSINGAYICRSPVSAGGSFSSNTVMSVAKLLSLTVASRSSCKKNKIEQR